MFKSVFKKLTEFMFSIDNSSGTGDHENWMLDDEILYQVSPTATYTDCKRIAVHVRSKENDHGIERDYHS